jgi:hypothetical protein
MAVRQNRYELYPDLARGLQKRHFPDLAADFHLPRKLWGNFDIARHDQPFNPDILFSLG